MIDRHDPLASDTEFADRRTVTDDDALRLEKAPLKQEDDALRDGSGRRQGQTPPVVDRGERTGG